MKIAQVTPYDFHHPGGVAEHIGHLREEFIKLGHEVVVIAPRSTKGGIQTEDGFYGIGRTISIPGNGSKVRLTFDVTLYNAVKELMRIEQFDVVHIHEPLTPVLGPMALLNSVAANVATFHAFRESNAWYTAFHAYMTFLLTKVDVRVAVSEPAREFVSQYFEGEYKIVPNGIDTTRFSPSLEPIERMMGRGGPNILFVGRYEEPRKGFKYLLRAMPLIRQQFPEARLTVVGTGRPEKFDDLIAQHGVWGVDFVGTIPASELPRYYASCDIFCAPSIERESFGIVLLEAMASGKPVVACDIAGYASVMKDGREGLLVPPRDPVALALAVVRLLSAPELGVRFAEQGLQTAQRYAWPSVAERVLEIYELARERFAVSSRHEYE
ncbi:MAG: glycosyltransferase family 4 protein [Thermomicrobiales bacterium]